MNYMIVVRLSELSVAVFISFIVKSLYFRGGGEPRVIVKAGIQFSKNLMSGFLRVMENLENCNFIFQAWKTHGI